MKLFVKKGFVLFLISILLIGMLAGCSTEQTTGPNDSIKNEGRKSEKIKIGVTMANFDDTFLTYVMDGMKKAAKKYEDIDIEFVDAKEDMAKQMNQVENFIVQQKDAIIIVPVDTSATGPMTEAVNEAGIKLVYVNRNPGNLPNDTYFVGTNEIEAGRLQSEFLAEALGGKGKITILMGKLDNEGVLKRTEGVEEVMSKYPDIEILDKQTGKWQRNEGMMITEDWLNRFGNELTGIASNNDDMALGAIQALKDAGREDVLVVGVDATPDGIAALEAGDLAATVFQDPDAQGGGAVEVAYKAVKGEKVDKSTWIPFQLVTRENVNNFK